MLPRFLGPIVLALALVGCGSSGSDDQSGLTAEQEPSSEDAAGQASATEASATEASATESAVGGLDGVQPAISELFVAALSMIPDVDGETIWFDGTNYARAFELTGLPVPNPNDASAVEQLIEATIELPVQGSAFLSVVRDIGEAPSEIGFSFAETRLAIATSGSIDTRQNVFVTNVEDWAARAIDPTRTVLDGPVAVIADSEALLAGVAVAKADGTSLADNRDVVDSLAILDAYGAYRFTYGNRPVEPFGDDVVPTPALAPYSSIATGVGIVDGAHLNILVLGHVDEAAANSNADLLRSVIADGESVYREQRWSDVLAVRSVEVVGIYVVAVLEPLTSPTTLDNVYVSGDSLLWFTAGDG